MVKRLSILVLLAGLAPAGANAAIIADSVADFSGTQGQNGWFYGYYSHDSSYEMFHLMEQFNGTQWYVDQNQFWTMLGPVGVHSNGTTTSGGRQPVEQWAARRWVSDFEGVVDIDATLYKLNSSELSNGITGRVYVDGVEIWSQFIGGTDALGQQPKLHVPITFGTIIDFVVDPVDSNDWSDGTRFSAVITAVPAPGGVAVGAMGLLMANRRRRK